MEQEQSYVGNYEHGLLQYQMECTDLIQDIQHTIMEEIPVTNEDGSVTWKKVTKRAPMINKEGMNSILSRLRSRLTKVFALSDFDDKMIEKFTVNLSENTIDDMQEHWDLYEIRSTSDASFIISLITDNYYAQLRKAKNANYLKFLKTSQIVQEQNVMREDNKHAQLNTFEENRKSLPFFSSFFKKR